MALLLWVNFIFSKHVPSHVLPNTGKETWYSGLGVNAGSPWGPFLLVLYVFTITDVDGVVDAGVFRGSLQGPQGVCAGGGGGG